MQHSERQHTYEALESFIRKHSSDPEIGRLIPEDFSLLFDGHLRGWESVILGVLVTSALYRGATVDDCARYATTGDASMPFEGCEQELFDRLLSCLRERTDDPDIGERMVRALADLQTQLIAITKRPVADDNSN